MKPTTHAEVLTGCPHLSRLAYRAVIGSRPEERAGAAPAELVRAYLADVLLADNFPLLAVLAVLDEFSEELTSYAADCASGRVDWSKAWHGPGRADWSEARCVKVYDGRVATVTPGSGSGQRFLDLKTGALVEAPGGAFRSVSYNLVALMRARVGTTPTPEGAPDARTPDPAA